MLVSASLLSCDLLNIESEINLLQEAGIEAIHIDVMDGHFVPNIAFGIDMVKQICKISKLPISVHLMLDNPEQFIDVIAYYNVNYIIIHSEEIRNVDDILHQIKSRGVKAGLAINPKTQVNSIRHYIEKADLALVMGVHPGFGGQTLIQSTLDKIRQIRAINKDIVVGIDGGINAETAPLVNNKKPDILIVGSYLFEHTEGSRLDSMKEKIETLCQVD